MEFVVASRLSLGETRYVTFDRVIIAQTPLPHSSLIDAIIGSIKSGTKVQFRHQGEKIDLIIGMIDFRSEPWQKKTPLFFGYEPYDGLATDLKSEEEVKAVWLGELTESNYQVVLRKTASPAVLAQTNMIRYLQTSFEWRTGFLDGILGHDDQPAFDVMVAAAKKAEAIQVMTSKAIFGFGDARRPYHPWYLPVQLERVFPWMSSPTIWNLMGNETEYQRRIQHGGMALLREQPRDEKIVVARPAAGYFFSSDSQGGSFRHDGTLAYSFEDQTAGGLIPAPVTL
jgi:hypothetical protein